ncbi:MAG: hypothetical protein P8K77_08870 [Polaribacter sp.]|nr:hypothetical protein [Polaribacter sp.]
MENKFTNIKDRVVEVAEKQDISKEDFFKSIGMTSASFRGKAKETPLNSNAIVNIITKYPDTDLYWLLRGSAKKVFSAGEYLVEEEGKEYKRSCKSCVEKDKMIVVLENQIVDLRSDKEDLKRLLGLDKKR